MQPQQIISQMVDRIVSRFDPDKVILFGSYARGEAGPDSDVDLLVVMPFSGSRREKSVEIRIQLHGMGLAKDIVLLTPEELEAQRNLPGTIGRMATRRGKVLYERSH